MSNYPLWWDTTITIFNKFENPDTNRVEWYSTVLHDCFWKDVGNKITINDVEVETNNIICRIPKNEDFLEKYEWNKLSAADKATKFTIGKGDIIIRDEVAETIDEYTVGHRSSDLITSYKDLQGCMIIDKMTIDTGIGRNNEHYYVIGT